MPAWATPIVQPGLIDNNCSPWGQRPGDSRPVASLTGWLPLDSKQTNADAAIAQVASRAVDPAGSILELGARQPDGTLAAAPPGISSTGGKGESAWLDLKVAKSGRTTGLTCGGVSALDLDVKVDYFLDCAETKPYLTKTFTHQLAVSGNQFSDAGDSGALVVDAANAEPVGLFFAGGTDVSGVSQGVANPAADVLSELGAQLGGGAVYVCGRGRPRGQLPELRRQHDGRGAGPRAERCGDGARPAGALAQARMLVNPSAGILGVATGKSSDHPGEAAVILYTDENMTVNVPATVDGVRTVAIPTTARAVAYGSAPQTPFEAGCPLRCRPRRSAQAVAVKNQIAAGLMRQNPAFFGVGVGQSLDNPQRGGAGDLRGPQPHSRPTAGDGRRPAHPLCGDGPAARDALLCRAGAVAAALHAAQSGRLLAGWAEAAEPEAELRPSGNGQLANLPISVHFGERNRFVSLVQGLRVSL